MVHNQKLKLASALVVLSQILSACGEPSHRGTTQIIQGFDEVSSVQLGLEDSGRGGTISATVPARIWSSNSMSSMRPITFSGAVQAVDASAADATSALIAFRGTLTSSDSLAKNYVVEVGCRDAACDRLVIAGPIRRSQANGAPAARLNSGSGASNRIRAALFERGQNRFENRGQQIVMSREGNELDKALEVLTNPNLPQGDRADAPSLTDF